MRKRKTGDRFYAVQSDHFFAVYFDRIVSFLKPKIMEILVKYNIKYIYIYIYIYRLFNLNVDR